MFRSGMSHLDFKHEFVATNFNTWGPGKDTSDDPKEEEKPPQTPSSEATKTVKLFTKSTKEITDLSKEEFLRKQAIDHGTTGW